MPYNVLLAFYLGGVYFAPAPKLRSGSVIMCSVLYFKNCFTLDWDSFGSSLRLQFWRYIKFYKHHFYRKFNFESIFLQAFFYKVRGSRVIVGNLQKVPRSLLPFHPSRLPLDGFITTLFLFFFKWRFYFN